MKFFKSKETLRSLSKFLCPPKYRYYFNTLCEEKCSVSLRTQLKAQVVLIDEFSDTKVPLGLRPKFNNYFFSWTRIKTLFKHVSVISHSLRLAVGYLFLSSTVAAPYVKGKKHNHFLAWLHFGITPSYSSFPGASCEEMVSGANRAHGECVPGALLESVWLGCRREGIIGEQQWHHCQGWDSRDWAM